MSPPHAGLRGELVIWVLEGELDVTAQDVGDAGDVGHRLGTEDVRYVPTVVRP